MRGVLAIVLLGAVSACAQSVATQPASKWEAPATAAQKENPLKAKPELAAGGEKIFGRTCVVCHGDAKKGGNGKGPNLGSQAVQQESDGALFWKLTNGNSRTGMPSFSSLPEGQRWQLVLYIRSLGTGGEK
jgi:mono/diheme cytochrome c family protein